MSITRYSGDTDIISGLSDRPYPTDVSTSAQLKAKFDEAVTGLKTYVNETLLPFLESASAAANIGVSAIATGVEPVNLQDALETIMQNVQGISQGFVADNSVTVGKMAFMQSFAISGNQGYKTITAGTNSRAILLVSGLGDNGANGMFTVGRTSSGDIIFTKVCQTSSKIDWTKKSASAGDVINDSSSACECLLIVLRGTFTVS